LAVRDDDAVMIRIEPDARSEGDTGERHGDAALAGSRLGAPSWDGGERLHTHGRRGELRRIPDAAVDDDAAPAVPVREGGQVAADERGPERAASVHHQDAPLPRHLEHLPHQGVVLEHAERLDRAGKAWDATPVEEDGVGHADLGAELIAEIGRGERHQRGGRRREAAGAEARWRRIRSTSARSSARSASIRSSERISSTTAAGDTDARAAAGAWAAARGASGGSGAMTDVTPRRRRGSTTKFHTSASTASASRMPCAPTDSAVGSIP